MNILRSFALLFGFFVDSSFSVSSPLGGMYAVGGRDENFDELQSVERYDPSNDIWTPVASMSTGREGLAVGVLTHSNDQMQHLYIHVDDVPKPKAESTSKDGASKKRKLTAVQKFMQRPNRVFTPSKKGEGMQWIRYFCLQPTSAHIASAWVQLPREGLEILYFPPRTSSGNL